jgi:hypothetical protein
VAKPFAHPSYEFGGNARLAAASKLASDYLAAAERAFRLRHMGAVRARIHAAGRRDAAASFVGVFNRMAEEVLRWKRPPNFANPGGV